MLGRRLRLLVLVLVLAATACCVQAFVVRPPPGRGRHPRFVQRSPIRLHALADDGQEASAAGGADSGDGGEEEVLDEPSDTAFGSSSTTYPAEEEEEDEEALKQRVLRQVSQLRREGPLSEVLGHIPEDALGIDLMYKGQANQAFKIFEKPGPRQPQPSPTQDDGLLFIKYAAELPGEDGTLLGKGRVRAEAHGYEEMAKHMAHMVPRVYVADEVEGLLIAEYLQDHQAFAEYLKKGEVGGTDEGSVPVQVARLLGKHHGTSMENPAYQTEEMQAVFSNKDHLAFWEDRFVQPLLNTLRDPVAHITKPYLAEMLKEVLEGDDPEESAALLWAVDSLRRSYAHKKQALVHADTHAQNILVHAQHGTAKLVDAEKSMWGPAGVDMGMWLANFAFYLAEERPDTAPQLCECMRFAWLHYEMEFMKAQAARGMDRMRTQDALRSIFNDAVGFMGLWLLFLTTSNPVEVLPFALADARQLEVAHANLLRMAVEALLDYKKYRTPMDLLAVPEAATAAENLLSRTAEGVVEEGPSGFDPEVAIQAWKRYEMGGKTRGPSMGVAGNNMQHVIELLRAVAVPLPPVRPVDPRTNMTAEKQAEEALYMKEVVLPDPAYTSKRADPDMFERDRSTNQWRRIPVYDEDGDEVGSVSAARAAVTNARQEQQEAEAMRIIMGGRSNPLAESGGDRDVAKLEQAMLRQELVASLAAYIEEPLPEPAAVEPVGVSFAHESGPDDLADLATAEAGAQARLAAAAVRQAKQEAEMAAHTRSDHGGELGGDMDNMVKADGLDEDVGKLRKMLNNAWPAFFQQMNTGDEAAVAAAAVAAVQQQDEAQHDEQDGEQEQEEPAEFDAFSGPSFMPFPLEDGASRSAPPQTSRQSWASKINYRNGEGKGPPGGTGGGRRKKQ